MARTAADLIQARMVAENYRQMATDIEAVAKQPNLRSMPLTVRVLRQWALVAWQAARAEEVDPEPRP